MDFPIRSESKADSDQTVSSNPSLSDGGGYSLHRNTLSTLLPMYLLPSAVLAREELSRHLARCILHLPHLSHFRVGTGLNFATVTETNYSPYQNPDHFISTLDFAITSSSLLMLEIQRLSVPTGYLPLPPSLDDGREPTDPCEKCLINNDDKDPEEVVA